MLTTILSIYIFGLAPIYFYFIFKKVRGTVDITVFLLVSIALGSILPMFREFILLICYDKVILKKYPPVAEMD